MNEVITQAVNDGIENAQVEDRFTDAAGSAGNHRNFSIQSKHIFHVSPSAMFLHVVYKKIYGVMIKTRTSAGLPLLISISRSSPGAI